MSVRLLTFIVCLSVCAFFVPRWLLGRPAQKLIDEDEEQFRALGDAVMRSSWRKQRHIFSTGEMRFDGQSAIAADQMTILALGQILERFPRTRQRYAYIAAMVSAADRLVDPRTLEYARQQYGSHGVVHMGPGQGHAYLGYINLGLGMLRLVSPNNKHAEIHDRITERLAARLFASKNGMIDTYPGEYWPPDVAAVAGSIALYDRALGKSPRPELRVWEEKFRACALHESGFLYQRLEPHSCRPMDLPRGSGTAVSAYFLSFDGSRFSDDLYGAMRKDGYSSLAGFGALKEYAPGFSGFGDGNSGPVIFGLSVGATGFGLGAAAASGDQEAFVEMFRTANLFGMLGEAKHDDREVGQEFLAGGHLGNALLLAMLTAREVDP